MYGAVGLGSKATDTGSFPVGTGEAAGCDSEPVGPIAKTESVLSPALR
jgi:hypothetical protein